MKNNFQKEIHYLIETTKNTGINDLPKVLINHLGTFFDLESTINFSSTNKKFKNLFSEFRKAFIYLNQINLLDDFIPKEELEKYATKNEFLFSISKEKDFSMLQSRSKYNLLQVEIQKPNPQLETVKLLLEYKCSVNLENNSSFNSLEMLSRDSNSLNLDLFKLLVEYKADINKNNKQKGNILNYVCENLNNSLEIVQFLVENKCRVDHLNSLQNTPLHLACENKNIKKEIIEYLISKKSELNQKNYKKCIPLHCLCENKNSSLDIIRFLVEAKSDLNCESKYDGYPLHLACSNENISLETIKYLIESKADFYLPNFLDNTPSFIANNNKNLTKQFLTFYPNQTIEETFEKFK